MNKEHLKKYVRDYLEGEHWKYEALYLDKHDYEMILASLEAEPCEDTISRKAAIRWVKTECNPYGKPTLEFESGKKVIEHLEQMPAAQPVATDTNVGDTISRQAAIDALDCINGVEEVLRSLPSVQPEYEPITAEDFAKIMSTSTIYSFISWHGWALGLIERQGFEICKKTT